MDLLSPKRITGIITQGAKDFGNVQFVSAYKVAYSNNGRNWTVVKDDKKNTDKVRHLSVFHIRPYFLFCFSLWLCVNSLKIIAVFRACKKEL